VKNEILSELANDERLRLQAFKVCRGNDLWKDVISEMLLYLAEMPEGKLERLYGKNELMPYCFKMIWLSVNSKTSPFYKKYIKLQEIPKEDTCDFDVTSILVNEVLDELEKDRKNYPTDINLYRLYLKFRSLRKVQEETGVPHSTIAHIVNRVTEEIKAKI